MMSKIIYKQISENSDLRLMIEYTMDGVNYTIDEPIKLNKKIERKRLPLYFFIVVLQQFSLTERYFKMAPKIKELIKH